MTEIHTDPDSLHYERVNELVRFRCVQNELRHDELGDWMDWLANALEEEIKYASNNRNEKAGMIDLPWQTTLTMTSQEYAEFDRWLRAVKAQAWAEGHEQGWKFGDPQTEEDYYRDPTTNPYKDGQTHE